MNESDEPFDNTPRDEDIPVSAIGEPLPAPLATAEQGREMETIWRMVNMVTPTKGQLSQSLKQFWTEFMARFRHYVHPLDQSRGLFVVCSGPSHKKSHSQGHIRVVLGRESFLGMDDKSSRRERISPFRKESLVPLNHRMGKLHDDD